MIVSYDFEAEFEICHIADFLESRRPTYGERFRKSVLRLERAISRFPALYARLTHTGRRVIRRAYIKRFKYIVDYQVFQDEIVILAVTYARRRSANWRRRMR